MESRMIIVAGRVQGVGFRYSAKNIADQYDITGYAANVQDYVEILATGSEANLEKFTERIIQGASPASNVEDYSVKTIPLDENYSRFETK